MPQKVKIGPPNEYFQKGVIYNCWEMLCDSTSGKNLNQKYNNQYYVRVKCVECGKIQDMSCSRIRNIKRRCKCTSNRLGTVAKDGIKQCSNCNTAIGLLKENPVFIEQALEYIKKHRENN